ncbi:sulfite exporter TauE/SafE family protein, partial [Lysinibacillus mangiferihumi]|uniref:sulfite exporter TauE/SafE family protein n=1 Tax=Lysinibacillus mangiferihumi TaxID=1130819 RepID=UPI001290325D
CFGSAITYISTGKIFWPLTIALMLGSIVGAQFGVRLARKLKTKHVKPLLRLVTVLLIVQMIVDYFNF